MSEIERRANAMLQEIAAQRIMLGDRAVNLAGDNALLRAEIDDLKSKLAELEKNL
jgi:hypothetical protein